MTSLRSFTLSQNDDEAADKGLWFSSGKRMTLANLHCAGFLLTKVRDEFNGNDIVEIIYIVDIDLKEPFGCGIMTRTFLVETVMSLVERCGGKEDPLELTSASSPSSDSSTAVIGGNILTVLKAKFIVEMGKHHTHNGVIKGLSHSEKKREGLQAYGQKLFLSTEKEAGWVAIESSNFETKRETGVEWLGRTKAVCEWRSDKGDGPVNTVRIKFFVDGRSVEEVGAWLRDPSTRLSHSLETTMVSENLQKEKDIVHMLLRMPHMYNDRELLVERFHDHRADDGTSLSVWRSRSHRDDVVEEEKDEEEEEEEEEEEGANGSSGKKVQRGVLRFGGFFLKRVRDDFNGKNIIEIAFIANIDLKVSIGCDVMTRMLLVELAMGLIESSADRFNDDEGGGVQLPELPEEKEKEKETETEKNGEKTFSKIKRRMTQLKREKNGGKDESITVEMVEIEEEGAFTNDNPLARTSVGGSKAKKRTSIAVRATAMSWRQLQLARRAVKGFSLGSKEEKEAKDRRLQLNRDANSWRPNLANEGELLNWQAQSWRAQQKSELKATAKSWRAQQRQATKKPLNWGAKSWKEKAKAKAKSEEAATAEDKRERTGLQATAKSFKMKEVEAETAATTVEAEAVTTVKAVEAIVEEVEIVAAEAEAEAEAEAAPPPPPTPDLPSASPDNKRRVVKIKRLPKTPPERPPT